MTTDRGCSTDDTADDPIDNLELYCPVCGDDFAAVVEHCPDDGTPLIRRPLDPMLGMVLDGRYRIVRGLGAGAMGLVYEGVQLAVGRPVAIKVIRDQYRLDAETTRRFARESRLLTSLAHPNIVDVYDHGTTEAGVMFLVMELLRGSTLADELERRGPFEWPRACEIAIQLCDALAAAHGCGVIHRDLKPANIVLVDDAHGAERVKVLDFGVAKSIGPTDRPSLVTNVGIFVGTPWYLAPESLAGGVADPRMDLYALGCVLHELVVGDPPFPNASVDVVLTQQLIASPPRLPHHLPRALAELVTALLAKSPDARPGSAADVAAQLRAIVDGATPSSELDELPTLVVEPRAPLPSAPPRHPTGTTPPSSTVAPRPRSRWTLRVVAALIVIAAIGFLVVARSL